jgi:hypothetical protein
MPTRAGAPDLLRWRLAAQSIAPAPRTDEPDVAGTVRRLLALQAQDLGQALWALGLRTPGSTRDDVLAALEDGRVVRSWPMRGTLHWTTPDDLRWMLQLTSLRQVRLAAGRHRQLGLDEHALGAARDAAVAALGGGFRLGRPEFLAALDAAGVSTTGQRGPHLIGHLAQTGVIVQGPPLGSGQAIVLLDEWSPETTTRERDEALGEFVLRYLTGHGPATLRDFVWWSKLTVADARAGLALAREHLIEVVHDDVVHFVSPAVTDAAPARIPATVHALPGFDEYLLGYEDRAAALDPEHFPRIVPGGNGVFLPMIVARGRIVGTWRRAVGKTSVEITGMPFAPLSARETTAFERSADAYGRFLGLPATVRWVLG